MKNVPQETDLRVSFMSGHQVPCGCAYGPRACHSWSGFTGKICMNSVRYSIGKCQNVCSSILWVRWASGIAMHKNWACTLETRQFSPSNDGLTSQYSPSPAEKDVMIDIKIRPLNLSLKMKYNGEYGILNMVHWSLSMLVLESAHFLLLMHCNF